MTSDQERQSALARFRRALRKFLAASEAISKTGGVTQQQYQGLLAISSWTDGAMSMKDLAEELLLTHHAAVQLVDRLTRAGLAQRVPSQKDRREVELSLTAKGTRLLDDLAREHFEELLLREPDLSRALRTLRSLKTRT